MTTVLSIPQFFFSFITFDFYFITSICWLSQLLTKNSISLTSNKQRGQDYSEHGYWMAGRLSLQTRYHIASLFQQTLFQQRHLLEAAPSYCSEGKGGKTPRRRSRKLINSIYHSRRDLSCVLPHHGFPQFYIFLHFVSDLEGEDGVGTCLFIEMKQKMFSFFNLPHPLTQKGPSWTQSIAKLQNGERNMSLQHQTAAGSDWEKWQTFLLLAFNVEPLFSVKPVCLHLTFQQKACSSVNKPFLGKKR